MTELDATVHETIEECNRNQWNNLVEQSEQGTVFHRYEWLRALETGLGREGHHIVVSKNGNPVALFPNFLDSIDVGELDQPVESAVERLPVEQLVSTDPGYGGLLAQRNTEACLDIVFDTLEETLDRSVLYHTIKTCHTAQIQYSQYLAKRGFSPSLLSCRFVVDLEKGIEGILSQMDRDRRRMIRKGREHGIDVTHQSIDEVPLGDVYDAYERNMNRVDGTVYPYSFLTALAEELPDRTLVFTATRGGDVIGRHLLFVDEEQSALRGFIVAIGDESHYQYNVSEILHLRSMEWGINEGYSSYDFGETGADYSDGLFKYKKTYGGEMVPTLRWQKGTSTLAWPVYKIGRRAYQKMTY